MNRRQLLARIDDAWKEFTDSYARLPASAMTEPGVVGNWSAKDIISHVTTWEEETLKALPLLMEGVALPRYTTLYGGVDAFNAQQYEMKKGLSLKEVLHQQAEAHVRLLAFLSTVPESHFATETRFRRRLRMDTYRHYPEHAASIRAWRQQKGL